MMVHCNGDSLGSNQGAPVKHMATALKQGPVGVRLGLYGVLSWLFLPVFPLLHLDCLFGRALFV